MEIKIKEVVAPLFGVIESTDKSIWRNLFSGTRTIQTLEISDDALRLASIELGISLKGTAADIQDYLTGSFPAGVGLPTGTIGIFGELLTLLSGWANDDDIVRVVSYRRNSAAQSKFPIPDFLLNEGSTLTAIEVKSTELLSYEQLTSKNRSLLQPCKSVSPCRKDALPQLGYTGTKSNALLHRLVLKNKSIVPFPVGSGIAKAVLFVDGRLNSLRYSKKFRTPDYCLSQHRDCWRCVRHDCNAVVATMPNRPDKLSLAGSIGPASDRWFKAYKRWTQALRSQDSIAAKSTFSRLEGMLLDWMHNENVLSDSLVLEFWGSYLTDSMRASGIATDAPSNLGVLPPPFSSSDDSEAHYPEAQISSLASLVEKLRKIETNGNFLATAFIESPIQSAGTVTVNLTPETIKFTLLTKHWWNAEPLTRSEALEVSKLTLSIILKCMASYSLDAERNLAEYDLHEITVGNSANVRGWRISDVFYTAIREKWYQGDRKRKVLMLLKILGYFQPEITLLVTNDGISIVSLNREIFDFLIKCDFDELD